MLRSVKSMQGYQVKTLDDNSIGTVYDFYFDDHDWSIAYFVIETGTLLSDRTVLLSPEALARLNWTDKILNVALTQEQIANSPDIETEKPLSREQEAELRGYYGWSPVDLTRAGLFTADPLPPPSVLEKVVEASTPETEETELEERNDYLRSIKVVLSYSIQARDGDAGHAEDFLIDDENWTVQYLVVDTRNWLPGRKVLVSPSRIYQIAWSESVIHIDLNQETIKNSPEYEPVELPEQEFEEKVYNHQN